MWIWTALALVAGAVFPIGTVRDVVNFSTSACPTPSSESIAGACFATFGQYPTTFCRRHDQNCSETEQRVASTLRLYHNGPCTVYEWTWTCAASYRAPCGSLWCDPVALCISNQTCVCPVAMLGDPAWHSCVCPREQRFNGTTCTPMQMCLTAAPTTGAPTTPGPTAFPTTPGPTAFPATPGFTAFPTRARPPATAPPVLVVFEDSTPAGGSTVVQQHTERYTIEQEVLVWPIVVAGLVGLLLGGLGGYWLSQSMSYSDATVGPAPEAPAAIYNTMTRLRQNRVYVPSTPQLFATPDR